MPSYFRQVTPEARDRVVERFHEMIPASLIHKVVDRYVHEQWLMEVVKNPRIMTLVNLQPGGRGVPWKYNTSFSKRRGKTSGPYLQSMDRYRAQQVLEDTNAAWKLYYPELAGASKAPATLFVRRVR